MGMTAYQIMCLVGVPAIVAGFTGYLCGKFKKIKTDLESTKLGVQALLRDRLLQSYNRFKKNGYVTVDEKSNFENMWIQYHNLGQNGVMDSIHDEVLKMQVR